MAQRAGEGFPDRDGACRHAGAHNGISFREAHDAVADAVRACGLDDTPSAIAAALKGLRPTFVLSQDEIERALDPGHFVRIRKITGGPAPERTSEALARARERQKALEQWLATQAARLDAVRRR